MKKLKFECLSPDELAKLANEADKKFAQEEHKELTREEEITQEFEDGYCVNSEDLEED